MSGPFGSSQWMYASGGFYPHEIDQSIRFASESSSYLQRAVTHNRKTFTYAFWFKRTNISRQFIYGNFSDSSNVCSISFDGTPYIKLNDAQSGSSQIDIASVNVQRDSSAWAHYVAAVDTTQSTESDRVKIYINGTQQTTLDSGRNTFPSQNHDTKFGDGGTARIGTEGTNARLFLNCYLAEFHIIDGSALGPDSFGETKNGIWVPKDTSGLTYGSGGVRLQFQDSSSLGDDTSGNGNDFTSSGLGTDHQVIDTPTNNFSVLKIAGTPAESGAVLSQGNLKCESTAGTSARNMERSFTSTHLMTAGSKWYVEHYVTDLDFAFGLSPEQSGKIQHDSNNSRYCLMYAKGGSVQNFQSFTGIFGNDENTNVVSVGDVVGMFVDMTVTPPKVTWSLNGQWGNGSAANQSNPTTFITLSSDFTSTDTDHPGDLVVWVNSIAGGQATSSVLNFGQDSTFAGAITAGGNTDANGRGDFKYAVPSGGLALCTANLPNPGIDPNDGEDPTDYFTTVIWTANGSDQTITTGFDPDFLWYKRRNGAGDHYLIDALRGVGGGSFALNTNNNAAEGGGGNADMLGTNGFTLNAGASGETQVGWSWKAGGSGTSNTDGSITSSVSATTDAGFSIVTYTGTGSAATVGHGLGTAPQCIFIKKRSSASADWQVGHKNIGFTKSLFLNLTLGSQASADYFNDTDPTSSVFSVKNHNQSNASGSTYVAYCFAGVEGYSKFGGYTGNGNDDGPFINVGFRPAWVMVKRTDTTNNWFIFDSVRAPSNPNDAAFAFLRANLSDAEASNVKFEFNSTAFKPRDASAGFNARWRHLRLFSFCRTTV